MLRTTTWQADALPESENKKKLAPKLEEMMNYLDANQFAIVNYGDRFRHGEPIATGFVESAVNQVVAKRFVKKQQMLSLKEITESVQNMGVNGKIRVVGQFGGDYALDNSASP